MPIFKFENNFYSQLEDVAGIKHVWRNAVGGGYNFKASDFENKDAVFFEAKNFDDFAIESNARDVLQNVLLKNLRFGWIDREGNFYSTGYTKHVDLIEAILGEGAWEIAEEQNWIKINSSTWHGGNFESLKLLNDLQARKLEIIGRSTDDTEYVDENLKYEDAFPKGNKAMDRLIAKYEKIVEDEFSKRAPIVPTLSMI